MFGKIARYLQDLKLVAFTGSYSDLTGKPTAMTPTAHTHTKSQISDFAHKHTKADITDFPSSMPASDVKAWAKAANKPSYNWSEIGNKPSTFPPSDHGHTGYAAATHTHNQYIAKDDDGCIAETIHTKEPLLMYNGYRKGIVLYEDYPANDIYGSVTYCYGATRLSMTKWVDSKYSKCELCLSVPDGASGKPYISANGTILQYVRDVDPGNANHKFGQIYSTNSTISTSDRNYKKEISYIGSDTRKYQDTYIDDEKLVSFIMGLMPCIYKFIDNNSNRPHHGLIAQDVEELLQRLSIEDHGAFIKSPKTENIETEEETEREVQKEDGTTETIKEKVKRVIQKEIPGEYIYSLRYEEFIADIIRFCQILYEKNTVLEKTVQEQQEKIKQLEERIAALEKIINGET